MPVPEPYGISGLWAAVKPMTQWPQADEDKVELLGLAWTNAGAEFFPHGEQTDPTLDTAWPDDDDNGKKYKPLVAAVRQDTRSASDAMARLGYLATEFGYDVLYAKTQITNLIDSNALLFQLAQIPAFIFEKGYTYQNDVARDVAVKINEFLRKMAARIEARNANAPEQTRPILDSGVPPLLPLGGGKLRRPRRARGIKPKLGDYFPPGTKPKASELDEFAAAQGWKKTQTENGPPKYVDENGVVRLTIKSGSDRAPGSGDPHVEIRDATGQRTDPHGNPVTRKSPGNHTPIEWDW